jgi:AcrR family transcriptional regulator
MSTPVTKENDAGGTVRESAADRAARGRDAGGAAYESGAARPVRESSGLARRPKRADARRNYDRLIAAAREAFTEADRSASLEDIARRAGVGIGTLYRHFPTRADLIEAVYVEEVEAVCRSASGLADKDPWDALVSWLHRVVAYMTTKQALAEELFAARDRDAEPFKSCRTAFVGAGVPLLERAQAAGVVRADMTFDELLWMVGGISKIPAGPAEIERVLTVALDGLRYRPEQAGSAESRQRQLQ